MAFDDWLSGGRGVPISSFPKIATPSATTSNLGVDQAIDTTFQASENLDIDGWPGDGMECAEEPPRPFDASDRATVLVAVERLQQQHGLALKGAGWTQETLWRGLLPEAASSWQTVPGLLHRLMAGDYIKTITPRFIELTSGLAWTSAGTWLAGPALASWKIANHKEI